MVRRHQTNRVLSAINSHFEAGFYVYLWANASVIAILVGKSLQGVLGLITVLPFVILYIVRIRRGSAFHGRALQQDS